MKIVKNRTPKLNRHGQINYIHRKEKRKTRNPQLQTSKCNTIQNKPKINLFTTLSAAPALSPGGDDRCDGCPPYPGELSGDRAASGGGAELITVPPDFVLTLGCLLKNSLGSRTLDTPKIATGFSSIIVCVTDARTIPVSMARDPLTREILRVKLPAPMSSVANVG